MSVSDSRYRGGSDPANLKSLFGEVSLLLAPDSIRETLESLGLSRYLPILSHRQSNPDPVITARDAASSAGLVFLSRGGKCLRPLLTLAAYDAVSEDLGARGASRDTARAAALAIEVFHKASLIHDDIEDGDAIRYGVATVHEAIGVPAAVNVGDYLVGLGYAIVSCLPVGRPEKRLAADLLKVLSDCHLNLARGQGAELWWRDSMSSPRSPFGVLGTEDVLEIYGLKTSPAFEAALSMGVLIAGSDLSAAGPLGEFALHTGNAFQILNDLKDWRGDDENLRAPAGDLLGGRPNVLLPLALSGLSGADGSRLLDAVRRGRNAAAEVTMLLTEGRAFESALARVAAEKKSAADATARCGFPRLRQVLDALLEVAIPVV